MTSRAIGAALGSEDPSDPALAAILILIGEARALSQSPYPKRAIGGDSVDLGGVGKDGSGPSLPRSPHSARQ